MNNTNLGKLIKTLRKQNNMRQEDLAQRLNVTISAVSKWETDKNVPDMDTLQILSEILNISLDDLYHPNETLARLNHDQASCIEPAVSDKQSAISTATAVIENPAKTHGWRKLLICISILILAILIGVSVYVIYHRQDNINIRPYGYRVITDEIYGEVYETGCIYSGNLEQVTLSDSYILALGDEWISNTAVSPDIHYMRVSFYQTEEACRNWITPDKTFYLYR